MSRLPLAAGRGTDNRRQNSSAAGFQSHTTGATLPVQGSHYELPHYPFQPLPPPNGPAPYRFDLSQLLHPDAVNQIANAGKLVFHCVGDTGDSRGTQIYFVAAMMTQDYDASAAGEVPAFFYHLGDVVYFAGDVDMYGECFYEPYASYPGPIVAIAGNHDCQPDDPQDGAVDPNKKPLDGWVQNFMSSNPTQLGSLKTNSSRTQMDLPNVYWTFTTPFATIIGLFSNVSETQAEIHPDQIAWFRSELSAADPNKALVVTIHHPPFSGDVEHSGSSVAEQVLFQSFAATGRYPHLILSGHVHNYQRFTVKETINGNPAEIACVVHGAGGYIRLEKLTEIGGQYPAAPLAVTPTLTLAKYDQNNFGFLRFEVNATEIVGKYVSAPFQGSTAAPQPAPAPMDTFTINLAARTVTP